MTLQSRLPSIVERLERDWEQQEPDVARRLAALRQSLQRDEPVPALAHYAHARPPWVGQRWSSLPFLHAEICLYQALLECAGYWDEGSSMQGRDVFAKQKEAARAACDSTMQAMLAKQQENRALHGRVMSSFFGNKTDLSLHSLSEAPVVESGPSAHIVHNDSEALVALLEGLREDARVDLVVDNYCFELFCDLLLARQLLQQGRCGSVHIHCKVWLLLVCCAAVKRLLVQGASHLCQRRHPERRALAAAGDAAGPRAAHRRAVAFIAIERCLHLTDLRSDHAYWNSHWEWFDEMPAELQHEFEQSSITIVKVFALFAAFALL